MPCHLAPPRESALPFPKGPPDYAVRALPPRQVSAIGRSTTREKLLDVYERMLGSYGPQHWWPGETRFEVMVGAILTQAAAWTNVEKAIANLRAAGALSPRALRELPETELASLVHPSGYYNAKARKLKALAEFLGERFGDDLEAMVEQADDSLRAELMRVHGIGEETADDIMLYAMGVPAFVVDAYTKRVFARLGLAPDGGPNSVYRDLFTENLPRDPELFGEYHALIVHHGRETCRKNPECRRCCLLQVCPTGQRRVPGVAIGDFR